MRRLKISIITPSFNQGKFIGTTIKSVVTQKGDFDLEYLIYDGGSTDNSVKVIKQYAKKYSCLSWVTRKDKGQVDALNQGLKKAKGDIIAYLNSDDYYLSGALQKVVQYFSDHPKSLWLVGNCRVTKKNLKWTFILKHLWPIDRHVFYLQVFDTINQPAVFLKRQLVKKVGLFSEHYHYAFDYDFWLRCLKFNLPARLKSDLAVFRIHQSAKGSLSYQKQFAEDFEICRQNTNIALIIFLHKFIQKLTLFGYKFLK